MDTTNMLRRSLSGVALAPIAIMLAAAPAHAQQGSDPATSRGASPAGAAAAAQQGPAGIAAAQAADSDASAPAPGTGAPTAATGTGLPPKVDEAPGDQIVVTGSRIVRNGYQAPTPVTVVAAEQLAKSAPTNIPDGLNQLPQFAGSRGVNGGDTLTNANQPRAGNYLNLRNVGSQRVLILMDGRRVPPTSFEGTVDTNTIPQALVQRVDVVTAGASAVYGADAVSGVVNFILDTKYRGIKGSIQYGQSEYDDAKNARAQLAIGKSFGSDDRGSFVASVDLYNNTGVKYKTQRPYLFPEMSNNLYYLAGTGTAADPYRTVRGVRGVTATYGGLITSVLNAAGGNAASGASPAAVLASSLVNQQFTSATTYAPLQFGAATGNTATRVGGDGNIGFPNTTLSATLRSAQAFAHARYDLTDNISGFVQGSYSFSKNFYITMGDTKAGATALQVYTGNAYLPPALQAQMTAAGVDSFRLSRFNIDLGNGQSPVDSRNYSYNVTAGLEGKFGAMGSDWHWDTFYTHGDARLRTTQLQVDSRNLFAATDAVRDATGNIVCRVSVTSPGFLPGCVPIDLFGNGTPSAAAQAFVLGNSSFRVVNKLDEAGANIGGAPFSTWAGQVAFNVGVNYRHQSLVETSNADPAVAVDFGSIRGVTSTTKYGFTNVGSAVGHYSVKEVYGEGAIPLAKDFFLAKALEINGAVRYTDYSTSGGVVTWKIGGSWEPFGDLRIRATRSKDIRAPTLYDLFAGRQINPASFTDTGVTNQTNQIREIGGGNPNLNPEVGYTTSIGGIFSPSWFRGFSASIDYYNLKILGAIQPLTSATTRDNCLASGGTDPLCANIIRPTPTSFPTQIILLPLNIASIHTAGIDFDVSYRRDLSGISTRFGGVLSVRALVNYSPYYKSNSGGGAATRDAGGLVGRSFWRSNISVDYNLHGLDLYVAARTTGKARRDRPENTGFIYIDNNVPAQTYIDTTVRYDLSVFGVKLSPFFTVNNLFDKKAVILPSTFVVGSLPPTSPAVYDVIGRRYTGGVQFRF